MLEVKAAHHAARALTILEKFPDGDRHCNDLIGCYCATQFAETLADEAAKDIAQARAYWRDAQRERAIAHYRDERRSAGVRARYVWLNDQPWSLAEQNERLLIQAEDYLDLVRCFMPRRVSDEELGDGLELIASALKEGRRPSWIYLKLLSLTLWSIINVLRAIFSFVAKISLLDRLLKFFQ
jgi:hypothetical protein